MQDSTALAARFVDDIGFQLVDPETLMTVLANAADVAERLGQSESNEIEADTFDLSDLVQSAAILLSRASNASTPQLDPSSNYSTAQTSLDMCCSIVAGMVDDPKNSEKLKILLRSVAASLDLIKQACELMVAGHENPANVQFALAGVESEAANYLAGELEPDPSDPTDTPPPPQTLGDRQRATKYADNVIPLRPRSKGEPNNEGPGSARRFS